MLTDDFGLECRACLRDFVIDWANITVVKDETSVLAAYVNCTRCKQVYKLTLRKHWDGLQ